MKTNLFIYNSLTLLKDEINHRIDICNVYLTVTIDIRAGITTAPSKDNVDERIDVGDVYLTVTIHVTLDGFVIDKRTDFAVVGILDVTALRART